MSCCSRSCGERDRYPSLFCAHVRLRSWVPCILRCFSRRRKGKAMYYDQVECGMRIAKLRVEIGKTQQQMADKLHISLDYYRALENGRRSASLELLVAMSFTFEVSLDYLILGRMKSSDSQRIQRELEGIMGQISRLKGSI